MAKVSVATVSRVINGDDRVKDANVMSVKNAISALNYAPNRTAQSLRKNKSRVILVFIPNFTNQYYFQILSGICDTSRDLNYSTYICNISNMSQLEKALFDTIQNKSADGIIFLACSGDDFWMKKYCGHFPIVFCSEYIEGIDFPFVGIDNYSAAYETVSHLISMGHEKIAMISSNNSISSTKQRFCGYCDALTNAGIYFRRDYIEHSEDYSFASGMECAKNLLSLPERPTAIFCVADQIALGALAAAEELNISVPEELTIWGFDDIEASHQLHPYLSTVQQPCYEMGCESMKILEKCIYSPNTTNISKPMPYKLIERESSASIKTN